MAFKFDEHALEKQKILFAHHPIEKIEDLSKGKLYIWTINEINTLIDICGGINEINQRIEVIDEDDAFMSSYAEFIRKYPFMGIRFSVKEIPNENQNKFRIQFYDCVCIEGFWSDNVQDWRDFHLAVVEYFDTAPIVELNFGKNEDNPSDARICTLVFPSADEHEDEIKEYRYRSQY